MKFFQKYSKWIIAFVFACAVIFVYKAFDNITNIASGIKAVFGAAAPIFTGFIIAYILNMPAVRICGLLKKSRNKFILSHAYGISVAVTYLAAVLVVLVLTAAILPALYENVLEIYGNLPEYVGAVEDYINSLEILKRLNIISEDGIDLYSEISAFMSGLDIREVGKYAHGIISVTSGVFDGVVAIIASVYMLIDKDRLISLFGRALHFIFKTGTTESIVAHASKINEIFVNYIYSRLICGIITGTLCGIALAILQVKYAILLAVLIALLDMIPYFGSIISCVIAIFTSLITGGVWKAIWSGVILLVLQQIDGNVLGPKIMGDTLEIRPFWIIFAVSFGGGLFGFWGMLISVPVVAAIKVTLMEYLETIEDKRAAKTAAADGSGEE